MLESFFLLKAIPANAESGSYQIPLVILSYVVATFASYTALSLAHLVANTKDPREKWWFHWGGAFAMGAGIWSMHFIGMLSYKMAMVIKYDPVMTLLSMLIAIVFSYGVLEIVTHRGRAHWQTGIAAVLLGLGICSMHYTGMAAMRMDSDLLYLPGIFFLSVAIAIAASASALWMAFQLARQSGLHRYTFQISAALIMGAAICGMHYTGMAASVFIPYANCRYDPNQSFETLALLIAVITGFILALALAAGLYKRSQIETQLEKTGALLSSIIESSDDAIISKTLNGIITSWNAGAEHLFGYTAQEAIGKPIMFIIPPERQDEERHIIERIRQGKSVEHFETVRTTKDGRNIDISLAISPIRDETGRVIGASKVARDVTQRKRTESALNESEKKLHQAQKMEAIGNLTGGMAHDFNNLLGVIIGNLDLLLEKQKKDDEAELTQAALGAAMRGADLTRRLLAFARQQPLQPHVTDVNALVEGITKLLARMLGEDIRVSLELAADTWPVVVDAVQLEAALTNLANNARDAMPHGGRLIVSTSNRHLDSDYVSQYADVLPGDYVVIEVSDTGTGIPPEIINYIFEPFFTTKERGKGTGLGLSMVFGFMKQSGGHINVYSELGAGTTFRIYLPRATQTVVPMVETPLTQPIRLGNETILVVEDNEDVRRVVVRQLRELGYHVLETDTADSGVSLLSGSEKIDLLFTDIVMPGKINGLELARLATQRWPGLKIILTSGFPEAKISGQDDPAIGMRLLSKPYRKQELARILREVLDGQASKG